MTEYQHIVVVKSALIDKSIYRVFQTHIKSNYVRHEVLDERKVKWNFYCEIVFSVNTLMLKICKPKQKLFLCLSWVSQAVLLDVKRANKTL